MPRQRGIPRRGSHTRSRGGSSSRGGSVPQLIEPLASVPPPSPSSASYGPSLTSFFHSARFKFRSKLNKPLISAVVTVLFSEEEEESELEEEPASAEESSSEQDHSNNSSTHQESPIGDVLNTLGILCDEGQQEIPQHQPSSSQEPVKDYEPASPFRNILHLVLPPGRSAMDVEDNLEVTWVNRASEKDAGSPQQD